MCVCACVRVCACVSASCLRAHTEVKNRLPPLLPRRSALCDTSPGGSEAVLKDLGNFSFESVCTINVIKSQDARMEVLEVCVRSIFTRIPHTTTFVSTKRLKTEGDAADPGEVGRWGLDPGAGARLGLGRGPTSWSSLDPGAASWSSLVQGLWQGRVWIQGPHLGQVWYRGCSMVGSGSRARILVKPGTGVVAGSGLDPGAASWSSLVQGLQHGRVWIQGL